MPAFLVCMTKQTVVAFSEVQTQEVRQVLGQEAVKFNCELVILWNLLNTKWKSWVGKGVCWRCGEWVISIQAAMKSWEIEKSPRESCPRGSGKVGARRSWTCTQMRSAGGTLGEQERLEGNQKVSIMKDKWKKILHRELTSVVSNTVVLRKDTKLFNGLSDDYWWSWGEHFSGVVKAKWSAQKDTK